MDVDYTVATLLNCNKLLNQKDNTNMSKLTKRANRY